MTELDSWNVQNDTWKAYGSKNSWWYDNGSNHDWQNHHQKNGWHESSHSSTQGSKLPDAACIDILSDSEDDLQLVADKFDNCKLISIRMAMMATGCLRAEDPHPAMANMRLLKVSGNSRGSVQDDQARSKTHQAAEPRLGPQTPSIAQSRILWRVKQCDSFDVVVVRASSDLSSDVVGQLQPRDVVCQAGATEQLTVGPAAHVVRMPIICPEGWVTVSAEGAGGPTFLELVDPSHATFALAEHPVLAAAPGRTPEQKPSTESTGYRSVPFAPALAERVVAKSSSGYSTAPTSAAPPGSTSPTCTVTANAALKASIAPSFTGAVEFMGEGSRWRVISRDIPVKVRQGPLLDSPDLAKTLGFGDVIVQAGPTREVEGGVVRMPIKPRGWITQDATKVGGPLLLEPAE